MNGLKIICLLFCGNLTVFSACAQINWVNIDDNYKPLPSSMHVYKSSGMLDGKPNIMYYAIADLKDKQLKFTTDTTVGRRLTPNEFFEKNNMPLLVVNCAFFSFSTNRNLNVVIRDGKLIAYNEQSISVKGTPNTYIHSFFGALGISKRRNADVAWVFTDSSKRFAYASQTPVPFYKDSSATVHLEKVKGAKVNFVKWNMQTAVGGGPVLLQNGELKISNNQERKFAGEAINNYEPRTAIGYTKDQKLIVLVCEGRSDSAAGLTLIQEAKILQDLHCVEAINLDGGGSSCLLINGKETNIPSSKGVQRPVPSVFLIEKPAKRH